MRMTMTMTTPSKRSSRSTTEIIATRRTTLNRLTTARLALAADRPVALSRIAVRLAVMTVAVQLLEIALRHAIAAVRPMAILTAHGTWTPRRLVMVVTGCVAACHVGVVPMKRRTTLATTSAVAAMNVVEVAVVLPRPVYDKRHQLHSTLAAPLMSDDHDILISSRCEAAGNFVDSSCYDFT